MHWRKKKNNKKVSDPAIAYERLLDRSSSLAGKGYVPVIAGRSTDVEDLDGEKFMVPLKVFKSACMKELLDKAAMEFGYRQRGVIRIPCEVQVFRELILNLLVHCL